MKYYLPEENSNNLFSTIGHEANVATSKANVATSKANVATSKANVATLPKKRLSKQQMNEFTSVHENPLTFPETLCRTAVCA